MYILENWKLVDSRDCFLAPEQLTIRLQGDVYGHPDHRDGTTITTTRIAGYTEDGEIITRSGTLYTLGYPDPIFEAQNPNALERIHVQLTGLYLEDK